MRILFSIICICLIGCETDSDCNDDQKMENGKPAFEMRRASDSPAEGFEKITLARIKEKKHIYVYAKPEILPKHVVTANVDIVGKKTYVNVELTNEGRKLLKELSMQHLKKPVAVFFFGEVVSLPLVRGELPGPEGGVLITGQFSRKEAECLCKHLSKKKGKVGKDSS
jgi:preprotein translocase subunit SecD